jgi:hypothetical protein
MQLKTTLFALLLVCILTEITAQTTLSDAYFPSANDSLQTAVALPQYTRSLRLSAASSTAQRWDFSFLRAALNSTAKTLCGGNGYGTFTPISNGKIDA